MPILVPCRGNVYGFNPLSGSEVPDAQGFYYVEGLNTSNRTGSAILIQSVAVEEQDVVLPVVTLNNKKTLYSFGSNFGDIVVTGLLLLGKSGEPGKALSGIIDFFEQYRVSNYNSTVTVSGPDTGWKMFLTGLRVEPAEAITNTQPFALVGRTANPKG